jgi:hypothetical protein
MLMTLPNEAKPKASSYSPLLEVLVVMVVEEET